VGQHRRENVEETIRKRERNSGVAFHQPKQDFNRLRPFLTVERKMGIHRRDMLDTFNREEEVVEDETDGNRSSRKPPLNYDIGSRNLSPYSILDSYDKTYQPSDS
jgi:hypothetical protein